MTHKILIAALGRSVWLFITCLLTPLIRRCFFTAGRKHEVFTACSRYWKDLFIGHPCQGTFIIQREYDGCDSVRARRRKNTRGAAVQVRERPGCHSSTDPRAARFAQRRLRQPLSSSTLLTCSDKHAEVTRDARGCGTMTACCVTLYVHLYCVWVYVAVCMFWTLGMCVGGVQWTCEPPRGNNNPTGSLRL